jgi:hypothetical protein
LDLLNFLPLLVLPSIEFTLNFKDAVRPQFADMLNVVFSCLRGIYRLLDDRAFRWRSLTV